MSDFQSILDEVDETETTAETSVETSAPDAPVAEPVAKVEAPDEVVGRPGFEPIAEAAPPAEPNAVTRDDGATWSDKAKRWYKDGKIVAGDPPAEPSAAKVEQAPQAPTPPVAPVAEAPKVETPAPEPFTFRGAGQKFSIPGMVVPPERAQQVRDLLAAGLNHQQNFPKMQREHKDALAKAEASGKAQGEKYNRASIFLFEKVAQLLSERPDELEMTRRELALMLKEADLTIPKAPDATAQDQGVDEQAARQTLAGYVTELLEDTPDAGKYFTDEDKKELAQAFQSRIAAYFVEHEGETVLDMHAAKKDFDREFKIAQRAHQARDTAARDAEVKRKAEAFNTANQPKPVQPPAPSRPKPALAAAPSGAAKPTWDQAIKNAFSDDDEEI